MRDITDLWVTTYTVVWVKVGQEPLQCREYTEIRHIDSLDALWEVLNLTPVHRATVSWAVGDTGDNTAVGLKDKSGHWGVEASYQEPPYTVGSNDFPDSYTPGTEQYPPQTPTKGTA